jgi:2-desacetyl-2-hydroxyethyl bacteriochlorophyllide A dehydrogenase
MQAIVYLGPKRLELQTVEKPTPEANEALIKVESVGICGSEIEGYLGHSSIRKPPLIMGHEFCGMIEELGNQADSSLKIGTKVVVNPMITCGYCDRCKEGRSNVCMNRSLIGIHRPGAFAQYVSVPLSSIVKVPQHMEPTLASLAEPLAVCVHSVKLGLQPLSNLLIYGAGPIGLLTLLAAKHMGAGNILLVDRQQVRLEHARRLGAAVATPDEIDTAIQEQFGSGGVSTIIDCVGVNATREQAMKIIQPRGIIIMVGLGQDQSTVPMNHLVRQELSIIGSYTYSPTDFAQAVALLVKGKIDMTGWTTTRSLSDIPESFQELVEGRSEFSKIFIRPS